MPEFTEHIVTAKCLREEDCFCIRGSLYRIKKITKDPFYGPVLWFVREGVKPTKLYTMQVPRNARFKIYT